MTYLGPQLPPQLQILEPALTLFVRRAPGLPRDGLRFGETGSGAILRLDLRSPELDAGLRERLWQAHGKRTDAHGVLLLAETSNRSQHANATALVERLAKLLGDVLPEP
ncbi:hypothetical protein HPC49_16665 [Pyxidicoccus fallax]|uniref:Uncharacterized protein n=1 Tax=Pyxidicoccus fallax TaxID=394095 RepID=A0A848LJB4_9BACT|nr:hypothetical protein [Pyxidicoccus fallax]NMO17810.1 hypothetical protein [Pyxidicoccus fallax]NPC79850.1 hypothetical protein [Pyxidicoccus fallax]